MAPGNFSNALGKRPTAQPQLGRPGTGEENLRMATGLRVGEAQQLIGQNLTALGFIVAQPVGSGDLPRTLAKANDALGVPRVQLPAPSTLAVILNPAAAPAGIHTVTFRVLGENQFGEPQREDFTISSPAGVITPATGMVKIFHRIEAVQIIAESNTNPIDQLSVDQIVTTSATNVPKFGLPIKCRDASDVQSILFIAGGAAGYLGQSGGTSFQVNIAEQSYTPLTGAGWSDAVLTQLIPRCVTSLGMDQGFTRPAGEKIIKNRG